MWRVPNLCPPAFFKPLTQILQYKPPAKTDSATRLLAMVGIIAHNDTFYIKFFNIFIILHLRFPGPQVRQDVKNQSALKYNI